MSIGSSVDFACRWSKCSDESPTSISHLLTGRSTAFEVQMDVINHMGQNPTGLELQRMSARENIVWRSDGSFESLYRSSVNALPIPIFKQLILLGA
jgi:hypothetical protein